MPTFPSIGDNTFPPDVSHAPPQTGHANREQRQGLAGSSRRVDREAERDRAVSERARVQANLGLPGDAASSRSRTDYSPLRSLESWAERARASLIEVFGEAQIRALPMDDNGRLLDADFIIGEQMFPVVYALYARKETSSERLSPAEQEQFIRELAAITEDERYEV